MKRRNLIKAAIAGSISLLGRHLVLPSLAQEVGWPMKVQRAEDMNNLTVLEKKHVPKIDVPESIKKGEWFEVKVTLGIGMEHPSIDGHYIQWIELLADEILVAEGQFTPTLTKGYLTIKIKLEKSATLKARAFCNLHGLWENEKNINVV